MKKLNIATKAETDKTSMASTQAGFKNRMFALPLIGSALKGLFGDAKHSFGKQVLNTVILVVCSPYLLFASLFIGVSNLFSRSAAVDTIVAPEVKSPEPGFPGLPVTSTAAKTSAPTLAVSPAPGPQQLNAEQVAAEQAKQQEIENLKKEYGDTKNLVDSISQVKKTFEAFFSARCDVRDAHCLNDLQKAKAELPAPFQAFRVACAALKACSPASVPNEIEGINSFPEDLDTLRTIRMEDLISAREGMTNLLKQP
ncbi:MAG: hypothetical protein V4490_06405 [Pseudomonadota bacterium]